MLNETEFSDFAATYTHQNFWQSNEMLTFESKKGWKIYRVGIKDDNTIIAAAGLISFPVFLSYNCFKILRGCMLDYDNQEVVSFFLLNLNAFLKKKKCLYAQMDPYITYQERDTEGNVVSSGIHREYLIALLEKLCWNHEGFDQSLSIGEPRWMSILPLQGKTQEDILRDMNVNTRRNIRLIEKNNVRIKELQLEELQELKHFIDLTATRKNFYHPALAYYKNMYTCFGDDIKCLQAYIDIEEYERSLKSKQADMVNAIKHKKKMIQEHPDAKKHVNKLNSLEADRRALDKRFFELKELKKKYTKEVPLAAALFIINKREVVYVFGGSDESLKKWAGMYAIQWYMIQYALQKGVVRYNFYGISGEFEEGSEGYGVFAFKKGFNANVEELPGVFTFVGNAYAYAIYQLLKKLKGKIRSYV